MTKTIHNLLVVVLLMVIISIGAVWYGVYHADQQSRPPTVVYTPVTPPKPLPECPSFSWSGC